MIKVTQLSTAIDIMNATCPPGKTGLQEVPTSDETALPKDEDGESWLELLRDGLDASVGHRKKTHGPNHGPNKESQVPVEFVQCDLFASTCGVLIYFPGEFF